MEERVVKKLHLSILEIMDEIVRICDKHNIDYFLLGGTLLGAVRHKGFIPWDDDLDIGMCRSDYIKFIKICEEELRNRFVLDCTEVNNNYYLPFAKIKLKNTIYLEPGVEEYNGYQGIWIDIFPIDNSKKQRSNLLRLQSFYINQIKRDFLVRLKFIEDGRVLKRIDSNNLVKSFFRYILCFWIYILKSSKLIIIQQKIMNLNKNNNSSFLVNFGSQYGVKKQTMPRDVYFPLKKLEFEGRMYKVPNDYDYFLKRIYGDNYMQLPPIEKRITHNPKKIVFEDGEEVF